MTQQYHLAFMAAWLSSTGISHHNLFLPLPSICLSTVNSSPHAEITLCSPNSQLLCLPGDLRPCPGMFHSSKDCLILIPFRLPQISSFTLSLKCFSSDSDNCPNVVRLLLQFPHQLRAGPVLLTRLFFTSSFILLSFAWFYIFFSAGQVLLSGLSWCSACTSVSEGVFLMHPWREMYSTFTYSSTIMFSLNIFLLNQASFQEQVSKRTTKKILMWIESGSSIWYDKILFTTSN